MTLALGIETSCDDTAVAVVAADGAVRAALVSSQADVHRPYGGVVPEIAARAHVAVLTPLIRQALDAAACRLADVGLIAATAGPGLIGGVLVGLVTAKALALAAGKPLYAINHLEGHALSPRLVAPLAFPYLLALLSGGHCQFLVVEAVGRYRRLGTTIDDAAGEAFDKVAKMLGLGYPGGPAVEALARQGDGARFALPRPLLGEDSCDLSLSGLKTAVLHAARAAMRPDGRLDPREGADLCAGFQEALGDCLVDRARRALARAGGVSALVVAGGVAANRRLRTRLAAVAHENGLDFVAPPGWLCTDNGAMIAWAGLERFRAGLDGDSLAVAARARWPLDAAAP
ncbi:MAG: tRNA (adenosine(37)-N6)-threonylcarbamoyltransferase complex transferase subunit TsaD, partial [Alphaproteobacteria bacterium]